MAYIQRVEISPDNIPPLLARVREIYEMPAAPDGHTGCVDCQIMKNTLRNL
ncbi:hypothetical protein ACFLVF_02110 [Chloroflexota bacterium]